MDITISDIQIIQRAHAVVAALQGVPVELPEELKTMIAELATLTEEMGNVSADIELPLLINIMKEIKNR